MRVVFPIRHYKDEGFVERTIEINEEDLPTIIEEYLLAHGDFEFDEIEIVNNSGKPVRYVEIGWLVKDKQGREYLAGSVPGSESTMVLPSGQRTRLQQDTALKFSRAGRPIEIDGMTAYVSQVEFADGHVWVPSRHDLDSSPLLRITAPSPEEQRLADIYSKKGLAALVAELNRY